MDYANRPCPCGDKLQTVAHLDNYCRKCGVRCLTSSGRPIQDGELHPCLARIMREYGGDCY